MAYLIWKRDGREVASFPYTGAGPDPVAVPRLKEFLRTDQLFASSGQEEVEVPDDIWVAVMSSGMHLRGTHAEGRGTDCPLCTGQWPQLQAA